jgi:hypothetical protein
VADEEEDDLDIAPAQAGALFRAEMWATNMLIGYWKIGLATLLTGLVGVMFFGQYQTYVQRNQRMGTGEVALIEQQMNMPIWQIAPAKAAARPETPTAEELVEHGNELMAVGQKYAGPAAVEAYLKAAELFRIAGRVDERRAALEAAAPEATGIFSYSVNAALANLDLEVDAGAEAETRLRDLVKRSHGMLADTATIDLGMALEHQGKTAEARVVYEEFLSKRADSTQRIAVEELLAKVNEGPPAVKAPPAPTPPPTDDVADAPAGEGSADSEPASGEDE